MSMPVSNQPSLTEAQARRFVMPRQMMSPRNLRRVAPDSVSEPEDEYSRLNHLVFDRYQTTTTADHEIRVSTQPSTQSGTTTQTSQSHNQTVAQRQTHPMSPVVSALLYLIPRFVYRAVERRLLYMGSREPEMMRCNLKQLKAEWGNDGWSNDLLDRIEVVSFNSSSKIRHQGWYVQAKPGKPTFVVSGGNMQPLTSIEQFLPLIDEGYGFLNYEYPGYGSTRGTPNEKRLYHSLEAARNFLNREKGVPDSMQIGYGNSLGGAVTVHSAAQRPFKAVILESTLTSVPDVVRSQIGNELPLWLSGLPRHVPSKFNSLDKISRIQSPLLIMHATRDPLVPSQCAQNLYTRAGTPAEQKWLTFFASSDHILPNQTTQATIRQFLNHPAVVLSAPSAMDGR
jgi:fermentation-respiration switch protein FrsA (DUF1100 family)